MKFIKLLPFVTVLDDPKDTLDCGLWQSGINECEMQGAKRGIDNCDNSGFYYGTSDSREPKFCARHFYQNVVNGVEGGSYILKDQEVKKV